MCGWMCVDGCVVAVGCQGDIDSVDSNWYYVWYQWYTRLIIRMAKTVLPETCNTLVLYVASPAWGLPSADAESLHALAYVSLTGVAETDSLTIQPTSNPALSPSGSLPFLRDGEVLVAGAQAIVAYLSRRGHDLDFKLSPRGVADAAAYASLVQKSLGRVAEHAFWVDSANAGVVGRLVGDGYPFPLSWILPKRRAGDAAARLAGERGDGNYHTTGAGTHMGAALENAGEEAADEVALYAEANQIYIALAAKLGENMWFAGEFPTSLDALVFGHLAVHYLAPLPNPRLSAMIRTHPNLVAFVERIAVDWLGIQGLGLVPPSSIASPIKRSAGGTPRKDKETPKKSEASSSAEEGGEGSSGAGNEEKDAKDAEEAAAAAEADEFWGSDLVQSRNRMWVGVGVASVLGYVLFYLGGGVLRNNRRR